MLNSSALVFFGAGLGGVLRYWTYVGAARLLGIAFPWGTLTVNIVGSTVMGILAGWFALRGAHAETWRLFLAVGVLGGYTTFSSFSLDAMTLIERGSFGTLAAYAGASLALSVAGLWLGLLLVRQLAV